MSEAAKLHPETEKDTLLRSQFQYALQAAEDGYHVFPCQVDGKAPLIKDWEASATQDANQIRKWWERWPHANIGAAVGASGVTVLDVDVKEGKRGNDSLWELEDQYGSLPRGRVAKTPTGGVHIHLSGITRSRNGALGDGLDVKSSGGYVLMPGSWIDGKPYRWAKRGSLIPAPAWFLERAGSKSTLAERGSEPAVGWDHPVDLAWARNYLGNDAPPAVENHGGDTTSYHVACKLRDRAISETMAFSLMAEIYNPRCVPPWPIENETNSCLRSKIRNAYKYAAGKAGEKSAVGDFASLETGGRFGKRRRFQELTLAELKDVTAPRWLVDRLMPENALAVVYGQPKSCKTFWAIDLSMCVATGTEFHGLPVRQGRVTYIAAEGGVARLNDRVRAWMHVHNFDSPTDTWGLIAQRVDLMNLPEVTELVNALDGKRDLIVIDTLARCMSGDENSQKDMSSFVAGCDRLREATGAAVLIVHHEGKDATKGARGSNTLRGAIDSGIRVRRDGIEGPVSVTVEDQRDGEPLSPMRFELRNVVIDGIEDASAALFQVNSTSSDADNVILDLAARLIGSNKRILDTATAKALNLSFASAVRRTHGALKVGRSASIRHGNILLWFEREDPKNSRSALIIRGEQISDNNLNDVKDN